MRPPILTRPDKLGQKKGFSTKTEYGYYIRRTTRYGKKRRQKTTKLPKNPEKVILGRIGDIEVYVYPHSFPYKVFFGIYPMSTYIEEHQKKDILVLYNKIRWYFNEEGFPVTILENPIS